MALLNLQVQIASSQEMTHSASSCISLGVVLRTEQALASSCRASLNSSQQRCRRLT